MSHLLTTVSRVPGSVGTEHTDSKSSALMLPEDKARDVEGCQHGAKIIVSDEKYFASKNILSSVSASKPRIIR